MAIRSKSKLKILTIFISWSGDESSQPLQSCALFKLQTARLVKRAPEVGPWINLQFIIFFRLPEIFILI